MDLRQLLQDINPQFHPLRDALVDVFEGSDGAQLVEVLTHYQNEDGGFAHGLEGDIQMPISNVVSTNMAVNLLQRVTHPSKEDIMQDIVRFYQSVYNKSTKSFPMVPEAVDDYPHAVWWNHDSLDNFTYANPNPEIAGTLFLYQDQLNEMDYHSLLNQVLDYIQNTLPETISMHSLMSVLLMYERLDKDHQTKLKPLLISLVDSLVVDDPSKWNEYSLEPYKIFLVAPTLLVGHSDALEANIIQLEERLQHGPIEPNWSWHQYMNVFESIKDHWTILQTYDVCMAIRQYRKQ